MGCVGSDGEDEQLKGSSTISKRFKIFKKSSNDYITTVDYASVPRKLRSAIKKRTNESISPPFRIPKKKLNHMKGGIGLPRKDGLKKFKKHCVSGGLVSEVVVDPITKDEEEVAETLYALAGMFHETVAKNKTEPSETKSTTSSDLDCSRPRAEVIQEEEVGFNRVSDEAPNHSSIQSLDDGSQPERSSMRKLPMELHNQGPKLDLASTVLNSKAAHCIQRLPCITLVSGDLFSTNKASRSNIHQPELSLASGGNADQVFKLADVIGGQQKLLCTASENRSNGSLWPGLSLTKTCDYDIQGPILQSSTSKFQSIFPIKSCFQQPQTLGSSVTTEKDARVQVDLNKSWKRCYTHVHISHLIKGLQKTERADKLQMQSTQSTTNETLSQGALTSSKNFTERSDNFYGIASTKSDICYAAERNSSEVRNSAHVQKTLLQDHQQISNNSALCSAAERNSSVVDNTILLHTRLLQDQQATATSRLYSLQKQSLEFFPLPGRGARGETTHGTARADTSIGTMAQLHIPYQKSKYHLDIPFLLRQNCYSSRPSISHWGAAATAQQAQLPPYQGSSSYSPSIVGITASSKQQQHWNNQFVANCKPGHVTPPNVRNWENELKNTASVLHHSQPFFPRIHSSMDAPDTNYIRQQQPPFTLISLSLPPSRVQGQHHQMPYAYQGNGGGHHPKSVSPLQLL